MQLKIQIEANTLHISPFSISTIEKVVIDNSKNLCKSPLLDSIKYEICSWITNPKTLQRISNESAESLTPEILERWGHFAQKSVVITDEDGVKPLGFCTISRQEISNLPDSSIELCHLIANPHCNFLQIGNALCDFAQFLAYTLGNTYLYGRVSPSNRYGLTLAKLQNATDVTGTEYWMSNEFRWFKKEINKNLTYTLDSTNIMR